MTTSAAKLRRDEIRKDNIPDMILDPSSGKRYLKGRFLGKVKIYKFISFVLLCKIIIKTPQMVVNNKEMSNLNCRIFFACLNLF